MQYLLPCNCGQFIRVSRSQAGANVQCPSCAATLEIPTIRGMSKLALADNPSEDATGTTKSATSGASTASVNQPEKSILRTSITALFFALFVVAGITTARWAVIRFMNPTIYTVEDEITEGEKIFAKFSPAEAWDAWQYYQSLGFKDKNASTYYRVKRGLELQDENMKIGAVVTLVAFIGLMGSILLPKRSLEQQGG